MMDALERKFRLLALKKAAIVMKALADSFKDANARQETMEMVYAITWAANYLEKKRPRCEIVP